MNYAERLDRFRRQIDGAADLVFLSISADLQYLTGVPGPAELRRGAAPGNWLEGAWMTLSAGRCSALPRMTSGAWRA